MRFLYLPFRERLYSEELGTYEAYGIGCWSEDGDARAPVTAIPDVTADAGLAAALAGRCTALQLCPLHLTDIVADTLALV